MDELIRRREHFYAKPWMNRNTVSPRRTYSGRVVYNRPKHYFGAKDVERIMRTVTETWDVERPSANALELAVASAMAFWIKALELLSWIDPWGISGRLQVAAQEAIVKLVGVDNERWNAWVVMDLIYTLATKQDKFEVNLKWRP